METIVQLADEETDFSRFVRNWFIPFAVPELDRNLFLIGGISYEEEILSNMEANVIRRNLCL